MGRHISLKNNVPILWQNILLPVFQELEGQFITYTQ